MKLRNKKTGKIGNLCYGYTNELCVSWQKDDGFWGKQEYNSLADLNEEWEDYEEPKTHWYIYGAEPLEIDDGNWDEEFINELKITGNYFETEEEAEKAVEKLKAWKRLKDKGFRFWTIDPIHLNIGYSFENYTEEDIPELKKDLYFCFGGEE